MRLKSIRGRILFGIGALQLCAAFTSVVLIIWQAQRESLNAFDANLTSQATALLALVQLGEAEEGSLALRRELLVLPKNDRYRLIDSKGSAIASTLNWTLPESLPQGGRAIFNLISEGVSYRVIVVRNATVRDPEEADETQQGEHHDSEVSAPPQHVTLIYASPTAQMKRHVRQIALSGIAACLATLILSLAMTFWIVRAGLRPLDQLASAASRLHSGNWEFSAPQNSAEVLELQPLSLALSNSFRRLKAAYEHERQVFDNAAHELKTAVAIVKSTMQLALQTKQSAAGYHHGLVRALGDTDRLENLVFRLLRLAAIESPVAVERSQTSADSAIASVIDHLAPVTEERGVEICLRSAGASWVDIPEPDFALLATNLIENAVQHSRSGRHVEVTIQSADNSFELAVQDFGCGIAQDDLAHIFERFYRTDQSRSRESGGFGLGLAIVQAVVVKYNGTIKVQSEVGAGTLFRVQFPRHLGSPHRSSVHVTHTTSSQ